MKLELVELAAILKQSTVLISQSVIQQNKVFLKYLYL
jgi:hypothetical protein